MEIRYLASGDTGLTVQFETDPPAEANARVRRLHRRLARHAVAGVLETVPTLRSLMVHYDPCRTTQAELIDAIAPLVDLDAGGEETSARLWRLPVCFEAPDFGADLAMLAGLTGRPVEALVEAFVAAEQVVNMIGFAPGQPYLGDLPGWLDIPRRREPVARVPAGSVLTATGRTVIYPTDNPTGWYVVGRTPVPIFRLDAEPPGLFAPGDRVRFEPIGAAEFERIHRQREGFRLEPEPAGR